VVETGTIKSVTITEGECACEVDFGVNQVETCVFYENVGNNNYPLPGDAVAVSMTDAQNTIIAVSRPIPGDLKKGEQVIYSRNADGEEQANIKLTDAGVIDLNKGDDFAVKFNELKKGFDALVNYVNALVLPVAGASAGPPAIPSTASIDASKVEKVKL
jgi:hypothetical protein